MRNFLKYVFILLIIIFLGFAIQTDYLLIKPGSVDELGDIIRVEGEKDRGWSIFHGYCFSTPGQPMELPVWYMPSFVDVRPFQSYSTGYVSGGI